MNRLRGVLGMLVTTVATESHRGLAVEGWVYNGLPWRITREAPVQAPEPEVL